MLLYLPMLAVHIEIVLEYFHTNISRLSVTGELGKRERELRDRAQDLNRTASQDYAQHPIADESVLS